MVATGRPLAWPTSRNPISGVALTIRARSWSDRSTAWTVSRSRGADFDPKAAGTRSAMWILYRRTDRSRTRRTSALCVSAPLRVSSQAKRLLPIRRNSPRAESHGDRSDLALRIALSTSIFTLPASRTPLFASDTLSVPLSFNDPSPRPGPIASIEGRATRPSQLSLQLRPCIQRGRVSTSASQPISEVEEARGLHVSLRIGQEVRAPRWSFLQRPFDEGRP